MRKRALSCVVLLIILNAVSGQAGLAGRLAVSEALYSREPGSLATEAYSAALAGRKNLTIGCYGEKRFLSDLSFFSLLFGGRIGQQPLQLSLSREGTNALSKTRIAISAARKLGKVIQFGIQAGYTGYSARGYSSSAEICAGAGVLMQLNERVRIGIQACQLNDLSERNEFRYSFRSGIGYHLSEVCSLTLEFIKESGKTTLTEAGCYYAFHPKVFARIGVCPSLNLFSYNIGYRDRQFTAEAGQSLHLMLGSTWGLNFQYSFNPSE